MLSNSGKTAPSADPGKYGRYGHHAITLAAQMRANAGPLPVLCPVDDLTPDFDVCPAVALLLHLDKLPLDVHQGVGPVLLHQESREKPYAAFHALSVGNQGWRLAIQAVADSGLGAACL